MNRPLRLMVNGGTVAAGTDPDRSLLAALREDLNLTAAKYGCGEGECGACTVLLGGKPIKSCRVKLSTAENKQIETLESLKANPTFKKLAGAFLKVGALQCGYCTPGMIIRAMGLLRQNAKPNRSEIISAMDGNLCRCGIYSRIISAIQMASDS